MSGYGWGAGHRNDRGNGFGDRLLLLAAIAVVIAVVYYVVIPKIKESQVRNNTYSSDEKMNSSYINPDKEGNPFDDGLYHANQITTGYFSSSARTDPLQGKFYFTLQTLDLDKKPLKQNYVLNLAVSNDKGVTKTYLCTDRLVKEDELDDNASITFTFSQDVANVKSGTIIYYSIRRNNNDSVATVGELTMD